MYGRDNEMDEWSEGAIKSCDAGTDSKRITSFSPGSLELTSTGTARLGISQCLQMEEIVESGGEAVLAGTSATANRRACVSASISERSSRGGFGPDCSWATLDWRANCGVGAFGGRVSAQHQKESVEVVIFGPTRTRETTQRRVFVDTPAPETLKELDEVVILVQQEYMQRQTDEHFNILVPVFLKDIVEVVSLVQQENVQ